MEYLVFCKTETLKKVNPIRASRLGETYRGYIKQFAFLTEEDFAYLSLHCRFKLHSLIEDWANSSDPLFTGDHRSWYVDYDEPDVFENLNRKGNNV